MEKRIYLSSPHMGGDEMKFINQAFDTNWVAPLGKNVDEFEKEVCAYVGRPCGVALSSGTAAIHLGLKYLGVKRGDIIFCQSFTFSASCNPALYEGAIPVFIDSESDSMNMCPAALARAYEKYPNPKAVIIVNLYGNPAKFDELLEITRKHKTPVLEDAAESLGSLYKGRQTGNFGDISVFSFNGNKIITTSGGGMAVADSPEAKKKMLFWATQSREAMPWYEHKEIGYNYRLSNITAGIGRGQMMVLDKRVERKREIHARYALAFKDNPYLSIISEPDGCRANCWLTVGLVSKTEKAGPLDIIDALAVNNIESRPAWKPMHMQPIFSQNDFITAKDGKAVCEDFFARGICLPSDTKLSDGEIDMIIDMIIKALEAANVR